MRREGKGYLEGTLRKQCLQIGSRGGIVWLNRSIGHACLDVQEKNTHNYARPILDGKEAQVPSISQNG